MVYRITRRGKPVAELRPIGGDGKKYRLSYGYGEGTVAFIASDFDAPLEDMQDYME